MRSDPMTEEEWLASVDATAAEDEPWWVEAHAPGRPPASLPPAAWNAFIRQLKATA